MIEGESKHKIMADGISLEIKDVHYSVKIKKGRKEILKGVTARAKPGRLLAIMGPSGSGKTSMLNLIGGKMQVSSGEISLNNAQVKRNDLLKVSSYVEQDDKLLSTLTVKETMELAAKLQLSSNVYTSEQKIAIANEVIDTLHLKKAADTMVGDPGEGIIGVSGGERKRCAVGVALVKNPQILLCDEPTSGLDASTAYIIIKTLRDLAREQNRTVVVTIHQPSSDVFSLFDDLLILQEGRIVYHGIASLSVSYFSGIGFPCPEFSNPADFYFMHVLSPSIGIDDYSDESSVDTKENDSSSGAKGFMMSVGDVESAIGAPRNQSTEIFEREEMLASAWLKSTQCSELSKEIETLKLKPVDFKKHQNTGKVPFWKQFQYLCGRAWKQNVRNKMRARARFAQCVTFAIIITLIYAGVGNDVTSLQDRTGVLFFVTANIFMSGTMSVVTTFANERATFVREYQGGLYSVLPYFLSKYLVETPFFLFSAFIYCLILYYGVGFQQDAEKFGIFVGIILMLQMTANSTGLFAASIFSRIEIAITLLPLVILPMMLFSGFVINTESIPVYFRWLEAISPLKYSFTALSLNEFTGLEITCSEDELQPVPSCPGAPGNETMAVCRYNSGDEYLKNFNFEEKWSIENCFYVLFALCVSMAFFSYLFLIRLGRSRSKAS